MQFKPMLLLLTRFLSFLPREFRYAFLAVFRNTPGIVGVGIRYACVRSLAASCGDNVYIGSHSFLSFLENCSLGNNISIRELCVIGCRGGLRIGNNVSIAHGSSVLTTEHNYMDVDIPIRDTPLIDKFTSIENDVWIGAGARVTAGVTIGCGSVVGAGSVVTRSVPPNSVVAGVPARIIKRRKKT